MKKVTCGVLFLFLLAGWMEMTLNAAEPQKGDGGTFYAVTFEPSKVPGELIYAANWRIWIPENVPTLRGVVIHQHGCGDGSAKPGNSAVEDWHWQALARKHGCALIAVSYEQTGACEMWCDPRNGSAKSLLDALDFFAKASGHEELTRIPWAIWGHSGGGQWTASMTMLFPERVLGAWCRSGHPDTVGATFESLPKKENLRDVPMILNLGVREKTEFKRIWDLGFPYVLAMRKAGARIAIFLDPQTGHCCGDSRYPAIRFLDLCMEQRLPEEAGSAEMRPMKTGILVESDDIWREFEKNTQIGENKSESDELVGEKLKPFLAEGYWFPTEDFVEFWKAYQVDGSVPDQTPPPAPFNVRISSRQVSAGLEVTLSWEAYADLESGLAAFIVERDGIEIARLTGSQSSVGRPLYQGLKYSDTPCETRSPGFTETLPAANSGTPLPAYSVRSVNSNGLVSEPGKER